MMDYIIFASHLSIDKIRNHLQRTNQLTIEKEFDSSVFSTLCHGFHERANELKNEGKTRFSMVMVRMKIKLTSNLLFFPANF